jgi:hypothetical protein
MCISLKILYQRFTRLPAVDRTGDSEALRIRDTFFSFSNCRIKHSRLQLQFNECGLLSLYYYYVSDDFECHNYLRIVDVINLLMSHLDNESEVRI